MTNAASGRDAVRHAEVMSEIHTDRVTDTTTASDCIF
jgi:hypothetical protein